MVNDNVEMGEEGEVITFPPYVVFSNFLFCSCSSETVKDYLDEYYRQSRKALVGKGNESLCLLCIQCFEVITCIM